MAFKQLSKMVLLFDLLTIYYCASLIHKPTTNYIPLIPNVKPTTNTIPLTNPNQIPGVNPHSSDHNQP